jgi:hypothetical protein
MGEGRGKGSVAEMGEPAIPSRVSHIRAITPTESRGRARAGSGRHGYVQRLGNVVVGRKMP